MSAPAIEAQGLVKRFRGGVTAVDRVDLAIPKGTVYGLIGRNGAGKTTLLRLMMGLLRPSEGAVRVLGAELGSAPRAHRARVAYVSQQQPLPDWMTLEELCAYLAHFYEAWDPAYAQALAARFRLAADRPLGAFSGGEQRKAALLLALAARPEVLLLDEPAAGLDPIARRELIEELVDVLASGRECTVVLSTHIIADLERIAESIGIMDHGRIVASDRLDALQTGTKRVQVVVEGDPRPVEIPGAVRTTTEGPVTTAIVRLSDPSALEKLRSTPGLRVNVFPLGLEDIFVELFGQQKEQP